MADEGVVRQLFVKLGFKAEVEGLTKFEKQFNRVYQGLKGFVAFKFAEKVGRALADLTLSAADQSVQLQKTSLELHMTTQELQRLQYAAGTANVDVGAVTGALQKINELRFNASTGESGAIGILAAMGARGKTATDALAAVADRFQKMPDGIRKTALAQRAGMLEVLPLLSKGGDYIRQMSKEADDTGYVIGDKLVNDGAKLNSELFKLHARAEGLEHELQRGLVPVAIKLVEVLEKWLKANRELFKLENIERMLARLRREVERFTVSVLALAAVLALAGLIMGIVAAIQAFQQAQQYGGVAMMLYRMAVWNLTKAKLGLAAAINVVQASALASALVWAALGVVIALVIQDLYTFATGGNSIIADAYMKQGSILRKWTDEWASFQEGVSGVGRRFDEFLAALGQVVPALRTITDLVREFLGTKDTSTQDQLDGVAKAGANVGAKLADAQKRLKAFQDQGNKTGAAGVAKEIEALERRSKQINSQREVLVDQRKSENAAEDAAAKNGMVAVPGSALNQQYQQAAAQAATQTQQGGSVSYQGGNMSLNQTFNNQQDPEALATATTARFAQQQESDHRKAAALTRSPFRS